MTKEIDFEEMNKLLYYDETSPSCLRWKVSRQHATKAPIHSVAGCALMENRNGKQYCKGWLIKINGKTYKAHRIVYALHHHQLETEFSIDHIDGNALNNQIGNLRAVTHQTNSRNRRQNINNKTGVTGVCYETSQDRFRAHYIDQQGRLKAKHFSCKKLGTEKAFELACTWRMEMIEQINTILGSDGYTDRHLSSIKEN